MAKKSSDPLEYLRNHPQLETCRSRYGKTEAWKYEGKEIAHTHLNGHLDVRYTRKRIKEDEARLAAHPAATLRGVSEWMEIDPQAKGAGQIVAELVPIILADLASSDRG